MTRSIASSTAAPVPRPAARRTAATLRPLDRGLRRAVLRRLEAVRGGRVVVRDESGTRAFGDPASSGGPVATVRVHDERFYRRVALGGSLGAAEAYIDGLWSCDDLPSLLRVLARSLDTVDEMERGAARLLAPLHRAVRLLRRNTARGSRRNIRAHYDLGNDLFALFLDETMTYSCGLFERADATMRDASVAKLDRICRALALGPDDHVLEIGTGWGSFAVHAASRYGCRVTTTTISPAQADRARRRIEERGLEHRIDLRLQDYRDLDGTYDKIVSIEMIEAVGHAFLGTFFRQCGRLLARDGAMMIQAITMPDDRYERYRRSVDFIQRHVFPGSCVPSLRAMVNAFAGTDLRLSRLEDITPHYVRTLRAWRERFRANLAEVRRLGYDDAFARLWDFYLCYCEAGFAERSVGAVQMLVTRPGSVVPAAIPPPATVRGLDP